MSSERVINKYNKSDHETKKEGRKERINNQSRRQI
jgi:hypothetical protein